VFRCAICCVINQPAFKIWGNCSYYVSHALDTLLLQFLKKTNTKSI